MSAASSTTLGRRDVHALKFPRLDEFARFVSERWAIHQRRIAGLPAPWTTDVILQTYRFTNVRREDDRVSVWVHNWAKRHIEDPDVWLAFYLARVFNRTETLAAVGWPLPWTGAVRARVYRALQARKAAGDPVFTAAYMVTSRGFNGSKIDYYMDSFDSLWSSRKTMRPVAGDSLVEFATRLRRQRGIAGFMAAQVVADVKHYGPLKLAEDWSTFAFSGPGSRRGLNWLTGRDPLTRWREEEWKATLLNLMTAAPPRFAKDVPVLDAQNTQNLLCEISKYFKVKYAGGRAKQLFRPSSKLYTEL